MPVAKKDSDNLKAIKRGLEASKHFAKPLWRERLRNFDLYVGKIPRRKLKSQANFNVPYAATLLDNVHPLLTAKMPFGSTSPRNTEKDRDAADLMGELLPYTYDVNAFDMTFPSWQKESMIYDISWLKVLWEFKDKTTDHPSINHVDTFNVYVHPKKVRLDDRWPIYQTAEMTKQEMKDMGWNARLINTLKESKLDMTEQRRKRLQSLGQSTEQDIPSSEILYEVVESWGMADLDGKGEKEEMAFSVMANNELLVNTDPLIEGMKPFQSPYGHGMSPYVPLVFNKYPHMFYGESMMSQMSAMQRELNSLENMRVDNYRLRNNPPFTVRRRANLDLKKAKMVAGMPWKVNEHNDVELFIIPDLSPSIDQQQNIIRQVMQARTGANDVLLVTDTGDIKGGDTALGASIANENTKLRFRPNARIIDTAIERVGQLCIGLFQDDHFFDRDKAIRIADKEGKFRDETIKPKDIKGDLVYKIESQSTIAESNAAKLNKLTAIREVFLEDPTKKLNEIDKQIVDAAELDWESIDMNAEDMIPQIVQKLRELNNIVSKPGFENQPVGVRNRINAQIQRFQEMLTRASKGQEVGQVEGGQGPVSEVESEEA